MFTDDSFGRSSPASYDSFSSPLLRRLFSLQVSVYVMSNWILCRARRGRLGERGHSLDVFRDRRMLLMLLCLRNDFEWLTKIFIGNIGNQKK